MKAEMLPGDLLGTILAMFLLLLVGYAAKRFNILERSDAGVLNSIILNLTMPAFIFTGLYRRHISVGQVLSPAVCLGAEILVMALAYLAGRAMMLDRRTTGALMLISAFGNTGFLGYPMTVAAFPGERDALPTAVMLDNFGMALPLYTIGVGVASAFGASSLELSSALAAFRTPVFIATVLTLFIKNLNIPQPIVSAANYLGPATVPLAMISLGLSLTGSHIRSSFKALMVATILKMVLMPVLVCFAMTELGASGTVHAVSVLESAVPPAIMAGVVAARYGANGAFAAGATVVMTIFSIAWIPAVLVLVR